MKKTLLMITMLFLLAGTSAFGSHGVAKIDAQYLNNDGCIYKDSTFVLEVWLYNDYGTLLGGSWPFTLYSDDGSITTIEHVADPAGISADLVPFGTSYNDSSIFLYNGWESTWSMFNIWYGTGWDGNLPDTINFSGISMSGWPTTADTTLYFGFNLKINTDGASFCIDSVDHANDTYDWLFDDPDFKFGDADSATCWCVGTLSDVASFDKDGFPTVFALGQNYPNPFNMNTTIEFAVPQKSEVTVTVFNILGQKVNSIYNDVADAGYHKALWDGTSEDGTEVSSGMYFYKIEADNFSATKKLVLLK